MKYTVAQAPLAHGKIIPIGGEVEMSEAEAKPLVASGRLIPEKKAAPKPSNKAAPKPSNK